MSAAQSEPGDSKSNQTAPGVKRLKQVRNIKTAKPRREKPPSGVVTDIYHVPARKHGFPRRVHGDAVE
ncbi:MAG: hypothetical protein V1929_07010 [bacterium]